MTRIIPFKTIELQYLILNTGKNYSRIEEFASNNGTERRSDQSHYINSILSSDKFSFGNACGPGVSLSSYPYYNGFYRFFVETTHYSEPEINLY